MTILTIIANLHAKADKAELVGSELEKLIDVTRAEPGCLRFELHHNNKDAAHFIVLEVWESKDIWQAHTNAPHLRAYMTATENALASFALYEMTEIVPAIPD